jgi:hypothetical protein
MVLCYTSWGHPPLGDVDDSEAARESHPFSLHRSHPKWWGGPTIGGGPEPGGVLCPGEKERTRGLGDGSVENRPFLARPSPESGEHRRRGGVVSHHDACVRSPPARPQRCSGSFVARVESIVRL